MYALGRALLELRTERTQIIADVIEMEIVDVLSAPNPNWTRVQELVDELLELNQNSSLGKYLKEALPELRSGRTPTTADGNESKNPVEIAKSKIDPNNPIPHLRKAVEVARKADAETQTGDPGAEPAGPEISKTLVDANAPAPRIQSTDALARCYLTLHDPTKPNEPGQDLATCATRALQQYQDLFDNPPPSDRRLARAYRLRGQFRLLIRGQLEVERNFKREEARTRGIAFDPADYDRRMGETSQAALADLEKSLELTPKNDQGQPTDIESLTALGAYWQTLRSLASDANDKTKPDPAARQAEEAGFRKKAEEYYREAIAVDPSHFVPYLQLAALYAQQGEFEKAVGRDEDGKPIGVLVIRMDKGFDRSHYLGWRDRYYMMQLRENAFRMLIWWLDAEGPKFTNEKERTAFRQTIIARCKNLHAITIAESPEGEKDLRAMFMKARWLALEGQDNLAIERLVEVDTLMEPKAREVRMMLARLYLRNELAGSAEQVLTDTIYSQGILRTDVEREEALSLLAQAYARQAAWDKAINVANDALAINPNNMQALTAAQLAYAGKGDTASEQQVVARQREVIGVGAESIPALLQDAAILFGRARTADGVDAALMAEAEKKYEQVLHLQPHNLAALRTLLNMLAARGGQDARIKEFIDQAEVAAKEAEAAATQPEGATTADRDLATLQQIDYLRIAFDPSTSDEEKLKRSVQLIKESNTDPYERAKELFLLYRQLPNHTEDAYARIKEELRLLPGEGCEVWGRVTNKWEKERNVIVPALFELALERKDWYRAKECESIAAKHRDIDPSGGHLFRGRLRLAEAKDAEEKLAEERLAEKKLALKKLAEEKYAGAANAFRSGIGEVPSVVELHIGLGQALIKLDLPGARSAFEEAVRRSPRNQRAVLGMALTATLAGDRATADRYLDICAQLTPNNPWVRQQLLERQQRADPAAGIAEREELRSREPNNFDNLVQLADLYTRQNQPAKAVEVFEQAIALEAGKHNLPLAQAYVRALHSTDPPQPEKAEAFLKQLLAEVDDPQRKAATQLLLAEHTRILAMQQQEGGPTLKDADASFIAAAGLSDAPEVRMDIGNFFQATANLGEGRVQQAREWYRKGIAEAEKNKDNPLVNQRLRRLLINSLSSGAEPDLDAAEREVQAYRKAFPSDADGLLFAADLQSRKGFDVAALELLDQFVERVREQPEGWYRRGNLQLRRSQWARAIADLRECKKLAPAYAGYRPRLLLAVALSRSGDPNAAIAELQSIIAENENVRDAYTALFSHYVELKRWQPAITLAEERIRKQPDEPMWYGLLARVHRAQGNGPQAVALGITAAEKSKLEGFAVRELLDTYMQFSRFDDLLAYVQKNVPDASSHFGMAVRVASAHAGRNDADKAVEWYAIAAATPDRDLDTISQAVHADLKSRIKADAMIAAADKRMASNPEDSAARLARVIVVRASGDGQAATAVIDETLKAVTGEDAASVAERVYLIREKATIAYEEKRLEEARKLYEQTLAIDPDEVIALNNLAYLLMEEMNKPQEALPLARKAVKNAPGIPGIADTLAWNLVLVGEYDEAINVIRTAIADMPKPMSSAHYHAAEGFLRRSQQPDNPFAEQDREEARIECRRAHELIMQSGRDAEGVLDKIVAQGEKLGLSLSSDLPEIATP